MYVSEPLADSHDLTSFDSRQPALDRWPRDHARSADAKRVARTYVWHDGNDVVVGYFTLCPHLIARSELPARLGRGDPSRIPGILLARLALDRRLQGKRLGAQLLVDALQRAVRASNDVGGRYVVVDAIDDDAARFYEHHDFLRGPDNTTRLIRKVTDIAVALGE